MLDHDGAFVVLENFARAGDLEVEVSKVGCCTAQDPGAVCRYPVPLVFAALGGVQGVMLMGPLQRDGWGHRGCHEFRGPEDTDVELFLEIPDAADGIGITGEGAFGPSVCNVNHAHTFQEEDGNIFLVFPQFTSQNSTAGACLTHVVGYILHGGESLACLFT